MVANTSQSTKYNRKRLIESKVEQIKISFSVRLMLEEDVHILCRIGRARDLQA